MAGVRRERRTRGCATQPRRVKPRPQGPSRKSRLGRPDPMHGMRSPGSHHVPGSVLGVQGGGEGRKAAPRGCSAAGEARGSGFTRQALSRSPAEPGPGAQPAALRSQPETWLSVSRPRQDSPEGYPPETPEESCATRPSSSLARPSTYRSQPRLRSLRRRLRSLQSQLPVLLTPGRPGSRPPPNRALRAPAAPWVLVGAAPRPGMRCCSLGRRY
nr:translation initiation factor IF-2-like [Pan troglodytes]